MADKTFGVKVTEEVYDKAKATVEMSGLTGKDWLEKVISLYELNSLKDGISSDYSNDLAELEVHTTRIYSLISNMVARSTYLKDHAVKEVSDKLDSKEGIIAELQEKNRSLKLSISDLEEQHKEASKHALTLENTLVSMQNTIDNNQALINEYKEKNDTLSGLVTKYQGYADENEALKKAFEVEKASLVQQLNEQQTAYTEQIHQLKQAKQQAYERVRELETTLENAQLNYTRELEIMQERKDLEREKALVEVEREYQAKLQAQNDKYNDKVAEMHAESERIRGNYEAKLEATVISTENKKK
ncbi:hypothetical protein FC756_01360 [Lysinibacillus mangiferihumi]|uniref:Uncharacterized protein n=1 Tax=Lysinibacillus mangiferihumi TaxID=1130819 RepID=A0A4V6X6C1_9BACI|nr:hypothetical protein [Lysinibacillus mangiferihumi]TKI72533.1 hypothetical protein FC756_01360 [Lysinibacillus mangiferihumi]